MREGKENVRGGACPINKKRCRVRAYRPKHCWNTVGPFS